MKRRARYSRTAGGAVCGCLLASILPSGVARADWETVPDVQMAVEANDNPRLGQASNIIEDNADALDHTAVRMLMDARFALANTGTRGNVLFQPRVRLDTYSDEADEDLEREDLYLNARALYRWTRTTAGLRVNLARESILSAELLDTELIDPLPIDPGLEDPIDSDTGRLVLLDEHRERAVLAPYAEFSISERSAITTDARYVDVSYTGPQVEARTGFSDSSLGVGVRRTIDGRTGASARIVASSFEADATNNETDTVGVEGSFNRELSEFWTFELTTGLQRSEFTFIDADGSRVDNAATNYTFDISFTKQTELGTLDISVLRLLNPNAIGFLVERDELRLFYRRQMSPRLSASLGLRAMETGALDGAVADREYARIDFDLEWAFSPSWFLNVGVGALDQKLPGERLNGNANIVSIGAVYRGLSRQQDR